MKVLKVQKKPLVVEAVRYDGINYKKISEWAGVELQRDDNGKLLLPTLEGPMQASRYDFIVKGRFGEIYAVKPMAFFDTYEILEE